MAAAISLVEADDGVGVEGVELLCPLLGDPAVNSSRLWMKWQRGPYGQKPTEW